MKVCNNGVVYELTGDAYADNGPYGGVRYYAPAEDSDGNSYLVAWDTRLDWDLACEREALLAESGPLDMESQARLEALLEMGLPNAEDESNACDWNAPVRVVPR